MNVLLQKFLTIKLLQKNYVYICCVYKIKNNVIKK